MQFFPTAGQKRGFRVLIRKAVSIPGVLCALVLSFGLQAQDDEYVDIPTDLASGKPLQEVADRAYDNKDDYWAGRAADRDGDDDELSAGEAVTEIFVSATSMGGAVDPDAKDIIKVSIAVINSWPDCQDTFDAVRAAVELQPVRADEIVANVSVKRNCNCHNGGIWLDQRVLDRIRVEMRHNVLEVPFQCSCSQIAMYAGIAGLPENREFDPGLPEEKKAAIIASMTEKVTVITERTASLQSLNGWDCGCTDVNIAASMQGIKDDELRDGTYDALAQQYADEAGDTGLVVDSFGVVGLYPEEHWGSGATSSQDNDLRRKEEIFRGDYLIMDPFDPATEFTGHGDRNFSDVGQHTMTSTSIPTDVFISEYLEGWNEKALLVPLPERDPKDHNRMVELYNGSEEIIDLGNGQYFLEIYGPGPETRTVVTPPLLLKKTISLQSDVTFEFDKAEIRAEASDDLKKVVEVLNEADIFSEILISGYTCDMGPEAYNLALSKKRANSVKNFLQESGLKDVPIRTQGLGEANPRMPNVSEANRARNRRVDITFVTKEGQEVESSVAESDAGGPKRMDYTFLLPIPPTVHEVESEPTGSMVDGEYYTGDKKPRQVIGLNGAVDPNTTFVIAYSESDEVLTDAAQVSTSQLDYMPNETLLLRRLGGEMALYCRAHAYAYITNYPPVPFVRYPVPDPSPGDRPPDDEVASPN